MAGTVQPAVLYSKMSRDCLGRCSKPQCCTECKAFGCLNKHGTSSSSSGVKSFFAFPNPEKSAEHRKTCQAWLNKLKNERLPKDVKDYKWSCKHTVCEDHFTNDCFVWIYSSSVAASLNFVGKKYLRVGAIPMILTCVDKKTQTAYEVEEQKDKDSLKEEDGLQDHDEAKRQSSYMYKNFLKKAKLVSQDQQHAPCSTPAASVRGVCEAAAATVTPSVFTGSSSADSVPTVLPCDHTGLTCVHLSEATPGLRRMGLDHPYSAEPMPASSKGKRKAHTSSQRKGLLQDDIFVKPKEFTREKIQTHSGQKDMCCVKGCSKRRPVKGSAKEFFLFPREKARCKRWLQICSRPELMGKSPTQLRSQGFKICSDHFEDSQFRYSARPTSKRLIPDAVPTLFKKSRRPGPKRSRPKNTQKKSSASSSGRVREKMSCLSHHDSAGEAQGRLTDPQDPELTPEIKVEMDYAEDPALNWTIFQSVAVLCPEVCPGGDGETATTVQSLTAAAHIKVEPMDAHTDPVHTPPPHTDWEPMDGHTDPVHTPPPHTDWEPMDIKAEPQDISTESQDIKTEPQDISTESQDIRTEPLDIKAEPLDINTESPDIKIEPVDIKTEPLWTLAPNSRISALNPWTS